MGGGGFTYGFRLDEIPLNRTEGIIKKMVSRREFDAVVFGNVGIADPAEDRTSRRLVEMWKHIRNHYTPNEIIIIDGRDPAPDGRLHEGVLDNAELGHYFLREVPDLCEQQLQ